MSISATSASNFSALRYSHDISASNLAKLLGLKRPSSITNIENGKATPSYEVLERYVDIFGVSMDWLTGRSSKIYTDDSLLMSESILISKLQEIDTNCKYCRFVPEFMDDSIRSIYYPPKIRGNIVFLMYFQFIPLLNNLLESQKYISNPQSFMDRLLNKVIFKEVESYYDIDLDKKAKQQLDMLKQLLNRSLTEPPYDIEKYLKQQQQQNK